MIDEAIGRAVVKLGSRYVRAKYKRQLWIGGALAAAAVVAVLARAARNVPEG